MKYNNINFILLRFIVFILLISCGGAPKPVDTPPPAEETGTQPAATSPAPDPNQQPPGRDTLDALNTAMARAENARNKALDVQGPVYFPEDWESAESKHEAGKNTKKDTLGGVNEAIALFNVAADAYDALASKSVPLFAKDQEDAGNALNEAMARAEQSRKQALDNQGPVYFPNDWERAESSYKNGKDAKKDTLDEIKTAAALYNAAADAYDDIAGRSGPLLAKERDDALKALNDAMARAEQSRKETLNVNGQAYFPKDWDAAESKNKAGQDAKKTTADEIKGAAALYVSAADTYDEITRKSRPLLAKEKDDAAKALNAAIARAEQSRKQALDVEGQSYFPNDWKNAESKHQAGKSAKKDTTDDIKGAAALYVSAADAFDAITGKSRPLLAKEKDDAAKALNAAIARAEQSRKQALGVEGQTYFPNDWKNAESKHQAGKDAKKTTAAEIKASTALYTTAADAYDDIVKKNNSRLTKEQEDAAKALNAAIAQMEKSRKQALDNQAPVYFPKDWDAAESKNKAGGDAKKTTAEEMKAAAALYISAADAYDWISGRSQALLAQEKDDAAKALNAAIARAEQSRKQALDNQAPVYFPKDWDGAESKNKAGKDAKKTTTDEIKAATALYVSAADAYDGISGKSQALLAQEKDDAAKALNAAMARAEQSRKQALDNQAPVYFPKDWDAAESKNKAGGDAKKTTAEEMKAAAALYISAADAYDWISGRSQALLAQEKDDAAKALNAAMARAEQSRKQALDNQGPVYFPKDWDAAESKNKAGKDAKKTTAEEIKAATALYVSAADAYDGIADRSLPLMAKEKDDAAKALNAAMARAEQSRKQALDNQGPVYFPKDWDAAESKNKAGKDAKKTTAEEIKAATALYVSAADAYDGITDRSRSLMAQEKDDAAKALNAAMARAEQSRKQALDNQAPVYFPKDWDAAESKNKAGKDAKKTTTDEIKAAAALYVSAADAYDGISGKSQALLTKEKDDAMKALNAAIARAEQSRKQALDNQAPVYFPKDWDGAESKNKAGKDAKKTTTDEIKAAAALYVSAADAYDGISGKSQALLAKEKEDAGNNLTEAMARAEQSRKQALDNQAPVYFPKDWDGAESKNKAGKDAKKTTAEEIKTAAALYVSAADAYDEVARKSRSRYVQDWEDAIKRERTAALEAGINDIAPEHLRSADRIAAETRTRLESNDYIPDPDAVSLPIDMYRALKPWADGYKVRQNITDRGFAAYDPDNLAKGDESIRGAVKDYEEGNPKSAQNKADEALARYNEALINSWTAFARDKGLEAAKERQAALAVKADVAVKNDFNRADGIYRQALKDFNEKAFEEAAELYSQSVFLFIATGRAAEDKRRRAEEAIAAAKQKTAESTAYATGVGLIMEGNQ